MLVNSTILQYTLVIGLTIFAILKNSFSYNPIKFTCDNYVLNSYLYLILSWAIILAIITSMANYNIDPLSGAYQKQMIVAAVIAAIAIVAMAFLGPLDIIKKHLLYIVLLVALAAITYPLRYIFPNKFYVFLWQTILILVTLAGISYIYPDLIGESVFGYMMLVLGGLIVSGLGELAILYFKPELYSGFYGTLTGYIGIALFMLFIVYDTNKIQQFAKNCVDADYIQQSTNLLLDMLNIMSNLAKVSNRE